MSFSTLGLSEILYNSLARHGYEHPTPVQAQSIPIALTGVDLIARAQTGTGKTAAFGLPMIDRLVVRGQHGADPLKPEARAEPVRRTATRGPRGLVLVPTRELAIQVQSRSSPTALP